MSQHLVCCIVGVCCPPNPDGYREKRVAALLKAMSDGVPWDKPGGRESDKKLIAEWLLDNFDLVPKGLGDAIVEAYRPQFARVKR